MLYYKISSSIISHYFISYSKYRPLPLTVQGGPIGLVGWKKNHPRFAPVFFSAKPCTGHWQRTAGPVRN